MTLDELIMEICYGCRHAQWYWDEDGLGRTFGGVIGCRWDANPFYNEGEECADCDEWEGMKEK